MTLGKGKAMIRIKRVYEPAARGDGARFLVDRLWPRAVKKEELRLAGWLKDVAPSGSLRKWFGHDPERWTEFQHRYRAELDNNPDGWRPLLEAARQGHITLVYGARDTAHNDAVVLQAYLTEKLA